MGPVGGGTLHPMPPFDAAIFDMDGVLVDSEPIWWQIEIELFGELGIPLTIEDTKKTMGMRLDRVVRLYYDRKPWPGPSVDEVGETLTRRVAERVRREAAEIPGAAAAVRLAKARGMKVALATSSPHLLIEAVLDRLDLRGAFDVVASGMDERYGKPHPAVFLTAAERMGVQPERCVVFEDSLTGAIAAKAASMTCVAIPHGYPDFSPKFAIADAIWPSLEPFEHSLGDVAHG